MIHTTKERNPDIEYLEYELEQYRECERRQMEEERQRREEHQRERQALYEERMRTASSWPEALQKQSHLLAREAALWTNDPIPDDFFATGVNACNRAIEIWKEIARTKEERMTELTKQLAAISEEIRTETAERLRSENDTPGWQEVVRAIADNDDLESWLTW